MTASLFEPRTLGALALSNAIVMAPMTRDRAGPGDVPGDLLVEYYRQRASAGLIVTEGVQPSADGKGYWRTPGIWSQAQVAGWRRVADAVHGEGADGVGEPLVLGAVDRRRRHGISPAGAERGSRRGWPATSSELLRIRSRVR